MKTPSFFLIIFVSLAICACENPFMSQILDPKTITFESNGGSPVPSQTVYKNEKISEPPAPIMAGYLFDGWWWFPGYGLFLKWNFNDIPQGDMTLFAAWNEKETQPPIQPNLTPVAEDFYFEGNWNEGTLSKDGWKVDYDGYPKAVTVIAKPGKTGGEITVYYQQLLNDATYGNRTGTPPTNPGTYMVTFDVKAAYGWNAAYGLFAEMLVIYIDSASELKNFLQIVYPNNANDPYIIPLNVSNLDGIKEAFSNISNVYVNLDLSGSNIVIIPDSAFYYYDGTTGYACDNLTGIIIPDSVKTIGSDAFHGCDNLASVTIGNGVTSIGEYAFYNCTSLASVNIPDGVDSIGSRAFSSCNGLTSVTIGNGVTSIGMYAFAGCSSLTSVTFATGSNIADTNFGSNAFPEGSNGNGGNSLKTAYGTGKAGTYKKNATSYWEKE